MELSSLAGTSLASLDFASKYHPCQSSIVVVPVHESARFCGYKKIFVAWHNGDAKQQLHLQRDMSLVDLKIQPK